MKKSRTKFSVARHLRAAVVGVVLVSVATLAEAQAPGSQAEVDEPDSGAVRTFRPENVDEKARLLSLKPFERGPGAKPANADTYDTYRKIRFRPDRAIWHRTPPGLEVHGLPLGWLYDQPVALNLVEGGQVIPGNFSGDDFIDERPDADPLKGDIKLSGFRINGPLNGRARADEIIVFQGASYFRALGQGHVYGLSARGLAIGTASIKGEEFPVFKEFWIEKPADDGSSINLHAVLDSPSTTGAFHFVVRPGAETTVDVTASLFPRTEIKEIGIAPLTSMFLLGPTNPTRVSDFRPRVHDSDGLAILNGQGERLWRALANPTKLQVSSFLDSSPRGFGLIQRKREFSAYQDLEARYERRPSAWIDLDPGLGEGSVVLTEIPTEEEIHDNIVVFWRPASPLQPGREQKLKYRLRWRDDAPTRLAGPWVADTRIGKAHHGSAGGVLVVVDYVDSEPYGEGELPVASASASKGKIENTVVQRNPETGGVRVSFVLMPGVEKAVDMRLTLGAWKGRVPETWLYRWVGA